MKFAIHTLGCKVNQYETEKMRESLLGRGLKEVDFSSPADIYIINTCTVTHIADRKSRQMIRRALKINPDARIAAAGCAVENVEALNGKLKEIILIPNQEKERIAEFLKLSDSVNSAQEHPLFTQRRTRALVKIQDGCNSFCSYCIVPFVRGSLKSRNPEEVIKEIKELEKAGYKEIVLTGIHLGAYGIDLGSEWNLYKALQLILENCSIPRIRLSSLEPADFDEKLISLMVSSPRLCRHFHLPLQHGSDKILNLMRRGYTSFEFRKILDNISSAIPDCGITTDVMVGFPGEGEEDFQTLKQFIADAPFSRLHVFKYSPRPGTDAANFKSKVPAEMKEERSNELLALSEKKSFEFMQKFIGKTLDVLIEEERHPGGLLEGISGNYIQALLDGNDSLKGKLLPVHFIEIKDKCVMGNLY